MFMRSAALKRAWRRAPSLQHGWAALGYGEKSFSVEASARTNLIKALREQTGAPIKDVKEVLMKYEWNQEVAFTELRKKGLAAATKKSGRVAAEGLLGLVHSEKGAAIVEINSETDFVARNDLFQNLVKTVANAAAGLKPPPDSTVMDLKQLEAVNVKMTHSSINRELSVRDAVSEVAAITGENVKLRRAFSLTSTNGVVSSYLHLSSVSGLARRAGLVSLEVEKEDFPVETLNNLGSMLAMHVVAARPLFLSKELVDPQVLENERNICAAQAAGKPAKVLEKIVEGRLSKFIEEVVLLEQNYVADETKRIKNLVEEVSKEIGQPVKIGGFLRMEVGEGIEK